MNAIPSRRERLRTATLGEIKDVARRLLVTDGPTGVSLRAIAREMGMTAPALYRYYPNLEQLVGGLCADLYDEVSTELERARDACAPDDPGARLFAVSREFRRWSIAHPAEFGLMFGSPLPGLTSEAHDKISNPDVAGARFAGVFLGLFVEIWQRAPFEVTPTDAIAPRLRRQLGAFVAAADLPPGAAQLFLSCWIRLYGMVAMEVFGHLNFALEDVEPMFEAELASCARLLGIPPR